MSKFKTLVLVLLPVLLVSLFSTQFAVVVRAHEEGLAVTSGSEQAVPPSDGAILEAYVYTDPGHTSKRLLQDGFKVIPGTTVYYNIKASYPELSSNLGYKFACDTDSVLIEGKFVKEATIYVAKDIECLYEKSGAPVPALYVGSHMITFGNTFSVGVPDSRVSNEDIKTGLGRIGLTMRELAFFLISVMLTIYALLIFVIRPNLHKNR